MSKLQLIETDPEKFTVVATGYWASQRVIAEYHHGTMIMVVSDVTNTRGDRFIDIRNWYYNVREGAYAATQKGVTIPYDVAQQMKHLLP